MALLRAALLALLTAAAAGGDVGGATGLLSTLRAGPRWTALMGDSVLLEEFLSAARALAPGCAAMAQDIQATRRDPLGVFGAAPPDYAIICRGESCELRHEQCLHFTPPEPCPTSDVPFCSHNFHKLCDDEAWRKFADAVTAPGVDKVLSFHWAAGPGLAREDPKIGLYSGDPAGWAANTTRLLHRRFDYAQPGAIVMNNCLHAWPYTWTLPADKWQLRLSLYLGALADSLQALAAVGYRGRLVFVGCLPLACNERFAWQGWGDCRAQNEELKEVGRGTKRLFKAMGLEGAYVDSWQLAKGSPDSYMDGVHPCWTRPCAWPQGKEPALGSPPGAAPWSGFFDTDPALCHALLEQALVASDGPRGAQWPGLAAVGAAALPSVADLWPKKIPKPVRRYLPPVAATSAPVATGGSPQPMAMGGSPQPVAGTMAPSGGSPQPVAMGGSPQPDAGTQAPSMGGSPQPLAVGASPQPVMGTSAPVGSAAQAPAPAIFASPAGISYEESSILPIWAWLLCILLAFAAGPLCCGASGVDHSGQKVLGASFRLLSIEFDDDV